MNPISERGLTNKGEAPTPATGVVRIGGVGRELLPSLRLEDLPPPGTRRWVMRRKAEVVAAVRNNLLTLEEACQRYTLSVEEFLSWQELIEKHGVRALRATRLKDYRGRATSRSAPIVIPRDLHNR